MGNRARHSLDVANVAKDEGVSAVVHEEGRAVAAYAEARRGSPDPCVRCIQMNRHPFSSVHAGWLVSIMLLAASLCSFSTWGGAAVAVWKAAIWSPIEEA